MGKRSASVYRRNIVNFLDYFTFVEPRLVKLRLFVFNQLKFHLSLILYTIWLNACIFAQKRRENFSVKDD